MAAGAWGMATGLIYVPGCYASTTELNELAKVVAGSGGIYASHIRNEEEGLLEAVDEAIAIGKSANVPVHISHLKANGKSNWGKSARRSTESSRPEVLVSWSRPISTLISPRAPSSRQWWFRAGPDEMATNSPGWPTPDRGPLLRLEIRRLDRRGGGAAIRIAKYAPGPAGWAATWRRSRTTRVVPRWRSSSTSSTTAAHRRSTSA